MRIVAFVLFALLFLAYTVFFVLDISGVIPSEISDIISDLIPSLLFLIYSFEWIAALREEMPAWQKVARYIFIFAAVCLSVSIVLDKFIVRIPRPIPVVLLAVLLVSAAVTLIYNIIQRRKS